MNSLGRTIQAGEKVILKESIMKDEYRSLEWRTVTVKGDHFGNYNYTTGTTLIVEWKDGKEGRISGLDIDAQATNQLEKTS